MFHWHPIIRHVVGQYLQCGDLRCGFARLWCASCRKDLLLPYSCKRRCFCSSCHQKRALLFAEHVDQNVLGDLPVRQYVVTIPKMLRLCFKYDRKLIGVLSQCSFASVKELFQDGAGDRRGLPGMIGSLQTYGDDPTRFHPHLQGSFGAVAIFANILWCLPIRNLSSSSAACASANQTTGDPIALTSTCRLTCKKRGPKIILRAFLRLVLRESIVNACFPLVRP
jgi:hypothetical protein